MIRLFAILAAGITLVFGLGHGGAAQAQIAQPQGAVVLTISGAIGNSNKDGAAELDFAMLEALPRVQIQTATPWTEGVQTFEGVALADLMAFVSASGTTIFATAINDYMVEIPMSDAAVGRALVALSLNGQPMSIREKGPLWIVYPYDSSDNFKSEVIYSRSIWQLNRLEVRP